MKYAILLLALTAFLIFYATQMEKRQVIFNDLPTYEFNLEDDGVSYAWLNGRLVLIFDVETWENAE